MTIKATYYRKVYAPGKPVQVVAEVVTIMAIVGNYTMVRKPGCVPFVVRTKELEMPE